MCSFLNFAIILVGGVMLLYATSGISELEIPNKKSLVIYISECKNNCKNCHTPYLHEKYGDSLKENFNLLLNLYFNYLDVVCFMGEGKNTKEEKEELKYYCNIIHDLGKESALYSGRDVDIEEWMNCFDYVKVGSYQENKGSLSNRNTNQKLYKKENNKYKDITYLFWK